MDNPHYQRIGAEAGVCALVNRFYDLMESLPEAEGIRKMHAPDLTMAREKLFMFLSGWLGGQCVVHRDYLHFQSSSKMPMQGLDRKQW